MCQESQPLFISTQRLFRLNAPWSPRQTKQWLRDQRFRHLLRKGDEAALAEPLDESQDSQLGWERVDDRSKFLSDSSIRRLCVVEDAGMGKTKALHQIQYLRQTADAGHLAVRVEFHELPCRFDEYLGNEKTPSWLVDQIQPLCGVEECEGQAVYEGLRNLVRRKIRQGKLTLLVDALDQSNLADQPFERAKILAKFLNHYSDVRCVVSGRPYSVQDYWETLFAQTGPWDLVQIDSFTEEERRAFLGAERFARLEQLEADVLAIPRALEAVRNIPVDELNGVRTASDLYWRCVESMLEEGLADPPVDMTVSCALKLFSLLAFETVQSGLWAEVDESPVVVDGARLEEFLGEIWDRREGVELIRRDYPGGYREFRQDLDRLVATNLLLDPGVLASKSLTPELRHLAWRNRTLQDFFAALWVTRYSQSDADREWLRTHLHIRGELDSHHTHPELYEFWRLAAEMPRDARSDAVWIRSLSVLYVPLPADEPVVRSTEMMYRSWRGVLGVAQELRDENTLEPIVQELTTQLQFRIRDAVERGRDFATEMDWTASAPMVAQQVLSQFLGEFPRLVRESSADSVLCRFDRDLPEGDREGFVKIPAGEFWMGDAECERENEPLHTATVDVGFRMSGCAVTNAIYDLFDPGHAERFSDYADFSPDATCPAIYLNWYDGWCVSLWLHGRLPSEQEWEYACRGQLGTDEPPMKWCFGDDESQLKEYAWYETNSESRTHSVGTRQENAFLLSDMHGNVWEWTSSWYYKDPEESRRSHFFDPVVRGSSFDFGSDSDSCRSACRDYNHPANAIRNYGVRVARGHCENLNSSA